MFSSENIRSATESPWLNPMPAHYLLPFLAVIGMGLCCGFIPQIHHWLERVFTYIQAGEMGLGDFIVKVAIPIAGTACIVTTTIVLYQKHQKRHVFDGHFFTELGNTIKRSHLPWKVIALYMVSLAGTALAIWYLTPQTPSLQHPIKIWAGVASLTFIAALIFGINRCYLTKQESAPNTQDIELIEVF
jgi:hypothetical protein